MWLSLDEWHYRNPQNYYFDFYLWYNVANFLFHLTWEVAYRAERPTIDRWGIAVVEFAKINTFPIGKKKKTLEKFLFSEYRHFMLEP